MEKDKIRTAVGSLSRVIAMRLAPGCDIMKSIAQVANQHGIKSGAILSGAASLRKTVLRNPRSYPESFPITDKVRVFTDIDGPLELLSLSGNISTKDDGEMVVHAHAAVSSGKPDGVAYGGHLVEGSIVYSTAEIILAEVEGCEFKRVMDPETRAAEFSPVNLKEKG